MKRARVFVVALLATAGCHSGNGGTTPSGEIFNPCVSAPLAGYDPVKAGLPGCCTGTSGGPMGPAHCVPNSEILPALAKELMACDSKSTCMPDSIIEGGGKYTPPKCTSSVGKSPGVCLSQCIPLVSNNPQAAFLSQDSCGDGDLCVPCQSPTDHSDTGACEIVAELCGGVDMTGGTNQCPYTGPPLIDPTTLPDCSPACGGAHCLPAASVPSAQQGLLQMCKAKGGGAGYCAPDKLIETGGNFVPKTCTSVAGAEGRCLSVCLPSVASDADLLPLDVCDSGEKCVPCFNPTASDPTAATGACTLSCDKPTQPPVVLTCPWTGPNVVDPTIFPDCSPTCGGAHCVPSSLVPAAEQTLLAPCNGGKGFCAPDKIIAGGGEYVPKTCTSVAGVEGRCISSCLPSVASEASLLPKDPTVCDAGEVCAPCYDPTSANWQSPTGACGLACDQPVNPPTQITCPWTGPPVVDPTMFPACSPACAGAHCLPAALVPQAQRTLLASCNGGKGYCAPDNIISSDNNFVPKTCTSVAGVEGRCTSICIPSVGAEASLLPADPTVCAEGEVCAPCYDPTSTNYKTPTGACSLGCDMPKNPPTKISCPYNVPPNPPVIDPTKFPSCSGGTCGTSAHCLPSALVPAAQQSLLAACGSGATAGFCTPDQIIQTDNNWNPATCTSIAGAEGRCLSTCLPLVASEAAVLPSTGCATGERCVPCYNPTADDPTAPTGACSLGCDAPTQNPVILTCGYTSPAVIDPSKLPDCDPPYNGLGAHCLPASLVSTSEQALLAPCGSGVTAGFCTPDTIITSDDCAIPARCNSVAGVEGRCLSLALPIVAQSASVLPKSGFCASTERCVPCYNPASSTPTTPTGACSIPSCGGRSCDAPQDAPTILSCPWTGPAVISPTNPGLPDCNPVCNGAHCLPSAYVPAGDTSLLATCGSGAAAGYCTPDNFIESGGELKSTSCVSFSGVPQSEGRCLSSCLAAVTSQPSLEQSSCASGDKCAPCWDPITGKTTGACGIGCDKPNGAPYTFPYCCNGNEGRCVPKSQVPSSEAGNLEQDSCSDSNYLCVPNENLPGGSGGQGCSASIIISYSGTCISNCVNLGIGEIFPQGNCPANHTCIPCGEAPSGSPGC
jgi:hypothetical protein